MRPIIVWLIFISLLILTLGCSQQNNQTLTFQEDDIGKVETSSKPADKEFEIYTYYGDRLIDETDKRFDAQDAGLPYKYANQEELENAVRKEVANKYGISEDELDQIYIKFAGQFPHG